MSTSLHPSHARQLDASAIAGAIRRERGYWSATDPSEWAQRDGDMAEYQRRLPGLAYPVYRLGRPKPYTIILRPDDPRTETRNGKVRAVKYEWPAGLPLCIDILPRYRDSLRDKAIPIWFTEGAKKADALASLGKSIIPASLNGVWCWLRKTTDGASVPLSDFDDLALKGREVVLAFDSDQAVNENVAEALGAFTAFLTKRGAKVGNLKLPHSDGQKLGVDDAIAGGWTFEQLTRAISWSEPDTTRFSIGTEDELMDLPPLEYLDRELCLVAGAYHLIYGASGSGKTFYAVERAMRQVALGRRVLYIATEDQSNLRYYVAAWRQAHVGAAGKLTWLRMPEGLDLQEYDQVAELIEAIAPYEYDHITLDTLREAHSGDENSSQDTARLNRAIQRLAATGAAVDVVHHAGVAGERPRGSTALFSNAGVVLRVEGGDEDVKINFEKLRDVPRDSLRFGFDQQDTGLFDTDGQPVIRAVLRPLGLVARRTSRLSRAQRTCLHCLALSIFVDAGAKEPQIAAHTSLARRTIYEALSALKDKGYVTQGAKGDPYSITNEGRAALGPELTLPPTPSADLFSAPESQVRTSADEVQTSAAHQTGTASVVRASADTLRVRTAPHLHQHTNEAPAHPGQVEEVDIPDPRTPLNQAQLIAARRRREGRILTGDELADVMKDSTDTTFTALTGEPVEDDAP